VELRYFAGFSEEEAAACLGVSVRTVKPVHRYLVYGPASNTSDPTGGSSLIAKGHATPFIPESFEIRVARARPRP
jgi:hypothetical protein